MDTILCLLCCFLVTLQGAAYARASTQQKTASAQQLASPQNDPANEHTIVITFDYDFQKNPPCAEKPALKTCIKQFVVYDVSGQRSKLFSIPVPDGARGLVKGIKGQSPRLILPPGTHLIAVTAQHADAVESDAAKVTVEVKSKSVDRSSPAK